MADPVTLGFPFGTDAGGRVRATGGDAAVRAKIVQLLFTAPGERVDLPEFGCGLLDLVFQPNDPVLAVATEFTVGQALTRWLRDDITVTGVSVEPGDESLTVEIAYSRRADRMQQAVRIQFT
jgi:phage baseplate assembly protein W